MPREIVTARLILRDLQPRDAEALFEYRSDPQISRYQTWEPPSLDEVRTWIQKPGEWRQLGIALKSTGTLIGDCGIHTLADPRLAELGITLAATAQHQGYASEAMRAVIHYLFTDLGMHRISTSVDPANTASLRLMQRLGFREEGRMVKSLWFKGQWVDDVIFALLAEEWRTLS